MPDQKISQLTDGGNAQAADEFVVARSGANYRIDGASVAAAATSVGTLSSLTVSGTARFASSAGSTQGVRVYGSSGANQWDIYTNSTNLRISDNTGGGSLVVDTGATIAGNLAVDTNTLYVDAANNRVGIGTASPATALHTYASGTVISQVETGTQYAITRLKNPTHSSDIGVDNTSLYLDSGGAYPIIFYTGSVSTERARITSGGYFKASNDGTYNGSTSSYHELRNSANVPTVVITNTNASFTDDFVFANVTATAAGTGFNLLRLRSSSVDQFRVRGDGTIYAQNTTVQSLSDARLKENISDTTEGLDVITALRPVRYDWKAGYGNDRTNQLGFIAQEVEAVFPEAVGEWEMDEPTGEVGEDGKPITEKVAYKTVGPGALIPVLVKAIQELEARIAALEA